MSVFHFKPSLEELNQSWLPQLDRSLGVSITDLAADSLSLEFVVGAAILQPHGLMHGGFSCVVGESLGSVAANLTLNDPNKAAVGQSLTASHIRPAKLGAKLRATARPLHLGGRTQIWETEIVELSHHKLIAKITLTVAIVERRPA